MCFVEPSTVENSTDRARFFFKKEGIYTQNSQQVKVTPIENSLIFAVLILHN